MAVEIACVLLLSTMLWDLSSGGKGGLQSHREPLSILGLAAVVVYFYISVFFYTRIESYSGKWYKSIITSIIPRITSITVSIIATVITTFKTLFIISIITVIRTSFSLFKTSIIIPTGTPIDTSLIRSMITSFSKSFATAIRKSFSTLFIASINTLIITPIITLISTSFNTLFGISIITSFSKSTTTTRTLRVESTGENLATSTTQLDRSQQRHRAHKSIVVHDGAFTNTSTKGELTTARAHKSIVVHDGAPNPIHPRNNALNDGKNNCPKALGIGFHMKKNTSKYESNKKNKIKIRKDRKKSSIYSFNNTDECSLKAIRNFNLTHILALNDFLCNMINVDCSVYRNDKNYCMLSNAIPYIHNSIIHNQKKSYGLQNYFNHFQHVYPHSHKKKQNKKKYNKKKNEKRRKDYKYIA
eukprot:62438_1